MYRFWHTGGLMTEESITRQVAEMKASGAGGFEANQLTGAVETAAGYDAETMGWGSDAWSNAQRHLFEAGKRAGLRVDTIYTPGWSAGTQTVSPDGPGSAKEIGFGAAWLHSGETYQGELPKSEVHAGATKRVLQGVSAYRCEENCTGTGADIPRLDPSSTVDLAASVEGDMVTWTAPAGPATDRYVIVASWMHGTGQEVGLARTADTTYLVDHFAMDGFEAIKDYTENEVMTPAMREAMRSSGGSFFFDSLELNREGQQVRSWTPEFLAEFEKRRGYSLVPVPSGRAVTTPAFDFAGDSATASARTTTRRCRPVPRQPPAAAQAVRGQPQLTVRGQAYSSWGPSPIESPTWFCSGRTSPRARTTPSIEGSTSQLCRSAPPATTPTPGVRCQPRSAGGQEARLDRVLRRAPRTLALLRQILLSHMNHQFAAGVNQIVYHGWATRPRSSPRELAGLGRVQLLVSDDYGPHNPTGPRRQAVNSTSAASRRCFAPATSAATSPFYQRRGQGTQRRRAAPAIATWPTSRSSTPGTATAS